MTSVTRGVLQPETFGFKWTIKRFFADCKKVGDFYKSPVFPIHYPDVVTKWSLQVYPKGTNQENKDYVSLYLVFNSENFTEVTVDYQLSIVNEKSNLFNNKMERQLFKKPGWGWSKFIHHSVIKNKKNGALINDTLTILCKITFDSKPQDETEKFKDFDNCLDKIEKGLIEDYEQLLETNYFSDVTFNMQDKKMYLHKAILMCRNSVFKAMFAHEMKEQQQSSVDIIDVDYEVMKELFRFIYSGKVENIEKIAKDLVIAADKYCVTELKALCEKSLYDNLTVDNAIECLKLTDMCDMFHLKTLIIAFIADHYKDIVTQSEFEDLHSSIMCEIFRVLAIKK